MARELGVTLHETAVQGQPVVLKADAGVCASALALSGLEIMEGFLQGFCSNVCVVMADNKTFCKFCCIEEMTVSRLSSVFRGSFQLEKPENKKCCLDIC